MANFFLIAYLFGSESPGRSISAASSSMLFSNSCKREEVIPASFFDGDLPLLVLLPVADIRGLVLGLLELRVTGERPCRDFGVGMRLGRGEPPGDAALVGVLFVGVDLDGVDLFGVARMVAEGITVALETTAVLFLVADTLSLEEILGMALTSFFVGDA